MWPDRVSNPGPLVLASDALPTAPRRQANNLDRTCVSNATYKFQFHRSISSEKEDFLRFLSYTGIAATLVV